MPSSNPLEDFDVAGTSLADWIGGNITQANRDALVAAHTAGTLNIIGTLVYRAVVGENFAAAADLLNRAADIASGGNGED